ncbi:translation initiation factor aIF5A [Candidatus Mancarchaeum acidiphilum]|uniref:Translation initiation factor 5A n=1 Tax=Candidatus Mancarchaeum acidiphilum TaxID=1920749 RepID=A0A218NLS5_9ARCH|nr:translation initiation factor IF-5A [Candidatus Mancarchaeum acidiphilum]ASI13425.1 translation initiation factor aIF5A [Candidatus Mancarchaeum acidiphilum]
MADGEIMKMTMKDIHVGRYIIIDGVPCKVVDIETSSPGKHGSAKMRVTAMGIFDGSKKTLLKPSDADADVPVIKKKKAQVVSISGNSAQIMDSETYEVYDLPIPEELDGKVVAGSEVEILEAMGKRAISKTV